MDNILLLGDSHTYGAGIDDASLTNSWKDHSNKSWAYHMFDKDKIENKSYPGCSNDTISLKLVRHVSNKDLVLIMFSYPERIHMTKNSCNFNVSHRFVGSFSDDYKENYVAKQIAEKYADEYKDLIIKYFDDNLLELLFLKNILFCQTFCQSNNLKYYFTMVDFRSKTTCTSSLKKYRDSLYKSIAWDKIFLVDNKYGFGNYGNHTNAKKGLDGSHWHEDFHKTFGKLFLKFIEEDRKKQESIV